MPLHYMQAFKVSVGVIKHIDKMRRSFIWKGNDVCKGINCLVNWEKVCALKANGGLEITNLMCQNEVLLAKWLWHIERGGEGLWSKTMRSLYGVTTMAHLRQWSTEASFFIGDLIKIIPFCSVSIEAVVGDKIWKWTPSGVFTCASAYQTMHNSGIISPIHRRLWKIRVPMKVRIFVWLMLDNKILTQRVLTARGCPVQRGCNLCSTDILESRNHIMWDCPYAARFWTGIQAHHNITASGEPSILAAWIITGLGMTGRQRERWDVIWVAGTWALWRERNRRLFADKYKPVGHLISDTLLEIHRWLDNNEA